MSNVVNALHSNLVFNRRTRVLADKIAGIFPDKASILDVGCGDGTIDALILEKRSDISVQGVDVLLRPTRRIHVELFDGIKLPSSDKSYDVVMLIDVLHHTDDPLILLREATRVARKFVVIKDHTRDGWQAYARLRFMDWVGNAHHKVVLPYNYWSEQQWRTALPTIGLTIESWSSDIPLYPFPASLMFGAGLHFVAALKPV